MKANPGGIIAPQEVIGRDLLIEELWDRLQQQSLIISAERRMGKTSVIRKMSAEPPANQLTIYRDLEGIESAIEFVEAVWQDVEEYLSRSNKTATGVRKFLNQIGGLEVSGIKIPQVAATRWKDLLTKIIEDLVENQDTQVVLLWDEMPFMLDKIASRDAQAAMEILNVLRSHRQTYSSVRMVFTGSIGLHHVVSKLKNLGYSNQPTNDMYTVDVKPLTVVDATKLSESLLQGENITTVAGEAVAEEIAQTFGCIPFYIHHLISSFKFTQDEIGKQAVADKLEELITDPFNPMEMDHYRERINSYYIAPQQEYALAILDILAIKPELKFNDLWQEIKNEIADSNKETSRTVLKLLLKDYYLIKNSNTYSFRYEIVRKYWQTDRDL